MADLFPNAALGEVVSPFSEIVSLKAQSAITKGQLVKLDTHTAEEPGSVSPAGAGDRGFGVAMQDIAAGEWGPVCTKGWIKVTGSGAITIGQKVKAGAAGVVVAVADLDAPSSYAEATMQTEFDKVNDACGDALQTFADGDTGIISFHGGW